MITITVPMSIQSLTSNYCNSFSSTSIWRTSLLTIIPSLKCCSWLSRCSWKCYIICSIIYKNWFNCTSSFSIKCYFDICPLCIQSEICSNCCRKIIFIFKSFIICIPSSEFFICFSRISWLCCLFSVIYLLRTSNNSTTSIWFESYCVSTWCRFSSSWTTSSISSTISCPLSI